jgi:hypothetical protein
VKRWGEERCGVTVVKKLENSGLNRQVGDGAEPTEKGVAVSVSLHQCLGKFLVGI